MHLYNSIKINNITNNELNIDAIIKNKNIKNINDIYPDFNWEIYKNLNPYLYIIGLRSKEDYENNYLIDHHTYFVIRLILIYDKKSLDINYLNLNIRK